MLALTAVTALGVILLAAPAGAQDDGYSAPGDETAARTPYRPSGVYSEDDNYRRYDGGGGAVSPTPRGPEELSRSRRLRRTLSSAGRGLRPTA